MPSQPVRVRYLFAVQFVLGLFFLLNGVILYPARPAFLLDVVLTPDELQDPETKRVAQAVLDRLHERNSDRNLWIAAGIMISAVSILGVSLSYRMDMS